MSQNVPVEVRYRYHATVSTLQGRGQGWLANVLCARDAIVMDSADVLRRGTDEQVWIGTIMCREEKRCSEQRLYQIRDMLYSWSSGLVFALGRVWQNETCPKRVAGVFGMLLHGSTILIYL